jgi:hypothetical protein
VNMKRSGSANTTVTRAAPVARRNPAPRIRAS